jgi:cytochrome c-type biogenesis protein CcmH/NrfG
MTKSKTDSSPQGGVSKGTLYGVAAVCLALGFFGGIVLSAWKSVPNPPMSNSVTPPQAEAPPPVTGDQMMRIRALEEETRKNPDQAAAWVELGNAYFDAGQPEKAIPAYQKSLDLAPDNADVLTDMGVMYRQSGQPEKAIAAFEQAVAVDPRHEIARYNKGIVLLHDLNDAKGAIRAWEDLIRVNPDYKMPTGQTVKEMVEAFKNRREEESAGTGKQVE